MNDETESPISYSNNHIVKRHCIPQDSLVGFVVYNSLGNKTVVYISLDPNDTRALRVRGAGGRLSIEPDGGDNAIIIRCIR